MTKAPPIPIWQSVLMRRFVLVLILLDWTTIQSVKADEPTRSQFVGNLAVMLEDEVVDALQLSEGQHEKLIELRETRESLALEQVLQNKDLPRSEQEKKLVPFQQESETLGRKILTPDQQTKLNQILAVRQLLNEIQPEDPELITPTHKGTTPEGTTPEITTPEGTTPETINPETTPVEQPTEQPIEPTAIDTKSKSAKLKFSFRYQPWQEVLDWFAEEADLSLVTDVVPEGTFNYVDQRTYTPAEAIDLLNSVLLTKGYTLVRRERMLMLLNLEDGVPPNLVSTVSSEELDTRGEYELVSVLFQLDKLNPEEAELELEKLIGPQGQIAVLPKAHQILVTETAGRLRVIRRVIQTIEDPEGLLGGKIQRFDIKHASSEEVLTVIRQLLDIPSDKNATADGLFRFSIDPLGMTLLATGKSEMIARVADILEAVDVPNPDMPSSELMETPQLEVYGVSTADPQSVLQVMQTLFVGMADVRLAVDPKTGNLVALARPSQHATIRATLEQMQKDGRLIEVFQLRTIDPQLAVLSINKLFGSGEEGTTNAPKVDADPTTGRLLIRGTQSQIEQIKILLEKLGESDTDRNVQTDGGNVRMLPLSGRAARSALERVQALWPSMRTNRIRVVTPSAVIPTVRPSATRNTKSDDASRDNAYRDNLDGLLEGLLPPSPTKPKPSAPDPTSPPVTTPPVSSPQSSPPSTPFLSPTTEQSTRASKKSIRGAKIFFAAQETVEQETAEQETVAEETTEQETVAEPNLQAHPEAQPPVESPPIIVAPGPGGIMIACQDIEALDEFEDLLTALASGAFAGSSEMTIFYLKHAKATIVAETLDSIFGGGTLASDGTGGGGLLGDVAGAALGDMGGGILGSLLGLGGEGGAIAPAGSLQITPDPRLNALVVQANPTDLDKIEQLLKILDQKESPEEILARPRPRLIPLMNTQAEEIAQIVKQVYQDRMVAGASGQKQPSPQEFIQMLRGGRRSRGSKSSSTEDVQKMSIGIDPRTNSLIVSAPEPLFEEVKMLVEQLDQSAVESNQAMRVVTLHSANPESVRQALSAMVGDAVQFGQSTSARKSTSSSSAKRKTSSRSSSSRSSSSAAQTRRRMEYLRNMQRSRGSSSRR